jgi:hypothetical protein
MKRQIEVTADVFHLIWSTWREGDVDENSILKRVLTPSDSATMAANRMNGGGSDGAVDASKEDNTYEKASSMEEAAFANFPEIGKIRWVDDVRRAFSELGGEADLSAVYPLVEKIRRAARRSVVSSLDATVRQTIEAHSSNSRNWKPGNADYFRHAGRGRWALR